MNDKTYEKARELRGEIEVLSKQLKIIESIISEVEKSEEGLIIIDSAKVSIRISGYSKEFYVYGESIFLFLVQSSNILKKQVLSLKKQYEEL
jgi:hypothetical protein